MVMNEIENLCQPATENFGSFQLRGESGVAILQAAAGKNNLGIRDAASPMCPDGILNFSPNNGDCFSILQNGTLFVPLFDVGEQYTDQYCVDNLVGDNGHQV